MAFYQVILGVFKVFHFDASSRWKHINEDHPDSAFEQPMTATSVGNW
jgi:hypothetical protein